MVKTLTIDDLYALAKDLKAKGLGKKKILISDDDEGNGYHELFFGFNTDVESLLEYSYAHGVSKEEAIKDYVILG